MTLVDYVRDLQLNYLAFPALSLAKFIANEIVQKESVTKLVKLKFVTTFLFVAWLVAEIADF